MDSSLSESLTNLIAFGDGQDAVQLPQPIQFSLITSGKSLNLSGLCAMSSLDFASKNPSIQVFLANS